MRKETKLAAVLGALERADGPLSANELWEQLRPTGIGIATVYRALKTGVERGDLQELDLPGGATRYEPVGLKHHHHFICSSCDRVVDVEGCVQGLESILPPKFSMTDHEVLLYGRCDRCQEAA